jgi:putative ABC transport system substrate-binding protein
MRRRDFLTLLGGAAAWPLTARAQRAAMPLVGLLLSAGSEATSPAASGFRKGLMEAGYVEGRNVAIEYRFSQNENNRLPELAAGLVRRGVTVIAAPGSAAAALAAKAATATIPIVFGIPGDPVQLGLVASLNRPGGNITGVTALNGQLGGKQIGLLRELLPEARRFAVLVNPRSPDTDAVIADLRAAAAALGVQIEVMYASSGREIDVAFASLAGTGAKALLIAADPLFGGRLGQLAILAARYAVPILTATGLDVRRTDDLRIKQPGALSPGGPLCGPHPQRRETGRSAGHSAQQIRPGYQPQHRAGARSRRAVQPHRSRRRGDRINGLFLLRCT